ncbi:MAG TPA: hypothetical protein VGM10_24450 [Actinocrinis sp.]|jgi:uncharacterized protein involved in copper resistance
MPVERFAVHAVAATAIAAVLAMAPATNQHTAADDSPSAAAAVRAAPPQPSDAAPTPQERHTMIPSSAPCSDAHQVGSTAYAYYNGTTSFSVKLYYSPDCRAYYGYAFPWLQFRHSATPYSIGLAVFDVTKDAIDGPATFADGGGGPDFWSASVPAAHGDCVEGTAHVFYQHWETDTYTAKYCG